MTSTEEQSSKPAQTGLGALLAELRTQWLSKLVRRDSGCRKERIFAHA